MDSAPKGGPDIRALLIDQTRNGSRVLVDAVDGKRVLVYGWEMEPEENCCLALLSGLTPLTGEVRRYAGCSWSKPVQAEPYCQTEQGEALQLLRGAVAIRGTLWYRQQ